MSYLEIVKMKEGSTAGGVNAHSLQGVSGSRSGERIRVGRVVEGGVVVLNVREFP